MARSALLPSDFRLPPFLRPVRILVIKPSSIGDIIHALVAAESLRRQVPGVTIDWVARDTFAPIVQSCSTVSRTYIFERKGGLRAFLRLIREIRETEYDAVLDMQGLARSAILTRCARAKIKIGRADAREGAKFLVPNHAVFPPAGPHVIDLLLAFLPKLGLAAKAAGVLTFENLPAPALPAAALERPRLVIFPDSRSLWAKKEWPYYRELTHRILDTLPDVHVVWAGRMELAPDPAWPAERFTDLLNKTTLSEAIALIQGATLCVGNDSGPLHIAAAAGRPALALFGPTNAAYAGPFPPERPSNRALTSPEGDLAKLPVETVLAATVEMWAAARSAEKSA